MKFTQIPADTFKQLQLNAGILLSDFTPADGSFDADDMLGATSGGVSFTAQAEYSDFAEDIDNAKKGMKEFKVLDSWTATMSGTFASLTAALAKMLVGAGVIDGTNANKIVPRNDLDQADFSDVWWVGDYSDKTGATNGGFLAIHLMNALSTGGFQIQSGDKAKGQFAFEFTGHYSNTAQNTVPFEIYVKAGTAEPNG
jgi:hypothetical protein